MDYAQTYPPLTTDDGRLLYPGIERMSTPAGELVGYVRESYVGLRGQECICIVGPMGRVFHFDLDDVETHEVLREALLV